ncbi:MAG: very short patch repair endonuclease [Acidimicrobiales bacterium]
MARQRTRDTAPELILRRALHRRGIRYRLHRADLAGRPDIVLVRIRLAVFVDGCFWHACPAHGTLPKANGQWWAAKLAATTDRDQRNDDRLRGHGWDVLHVWEHDDPDVVADDIWSRWMRDP